MTKCCSDARGAGGGFFKCFFSYGTALIEGGGIAVVSSASHSITIEDTNLLDNFGRYVSEIFISIISSYITVELYMLNLTIVHSTTMSSDTVDRR